MSERSEDKTDSSARRSSVCYPPAWGETLRYETDDCDIDDSELSIYQGGNGDWYIGVAEKGRHPKRVVRIRTSGGSCPPFGWAIADAYRSLRGHERGDDAGKLYDALRLLCSEVENNPSESTQKVIASAIEMYEMKRQFGG